MVPPPARACSRAAAKISASAAVIEITFARMNIAPWSNSFSSVTLLVNTGTGVGARDFSGGDLCRAFLGGFPERKLRALVGDLQRAEKMNQVPGLFRLDHVGERRHWRAVQPGHKNFVEVMVGRTALEARAHCEIVGTNRLIVAIGQGRCRRAIAASFRAMALPALQLLEKLLAVLNRFDTELRLGWDINRITGLFALETRRKAFDERNEVGALLLGERNPRWHVAHNEATADGVVKIFVQRQSSGRRRSALKDGCVKIARLDIQIRLRRVIAGRQPVLAAAIAAKAVASPAKAKIELLAGIGMASELAHVRFGFLGSG